MIFLVPSPGHPCEYNVRDSGFVNIDPRIYTLFLYVDETISEDAVKEFESFARSLARDTNLILHVVQVGNSESTTAMEYYRFWNVESLPALIMVSPDKRSILLFEQGETEDRYLGLWERLERALSSPVRKAVLENIIQAYAVVLFVEGTDPEKNRTARETIKKASSEISHMMKQLPKRIERPPHIISLTRDNIEQESILLWSLDISINEMENPRIVILYGRGRIFLSPFQGDHLSASQLTNILSILGLACDCGLDKGGMMGPTIPLKWDRKSQTEVVKYLGFDAENPMIKREISGILSIENFRESATSQDKDSIKETLRELALYNESIQSFEPRFGDNRLSPVQQRRLGNSGRGATHSGLNLTLFLIIGSVIFLFALVAGLFILIRSRAQKS